MNILTYKGYAARIAFDAEDEIFFGNLAGVADVIGFHADSVFLDRTAAWPADQRPHCLHCWRQGNGRPLPCCSACGWRF